MDSLGKKAGYLKGLMEGMTFVNPGQEKLAKAVIDLLGDLCDRVEATDDMLDELNDYVESIDDDLSQLEDEHEDFSMADDDIDDEEFMDDVDASARLHLIGGNDAAEEEEDAPTIAGVVCPDCHQPFFVGLEDPEDASYVCPHCGNRVTPEPLTAENAPIADPLQED